MGASFAGSTTPTGKTLLGDGCGTTPHSRQQFIQPFTLDFSVEVSQSFGNCQRRCNEFDVGQRPQLEQPIVVTISRREEHVRIEKDAVHRSGPVRTVMENRVRVQAQLADLLARLGIVDRIDRVG